MKKARLAFLSILLVVVAAAAAAGAARIETNPSFVGYASKRIIVQFEEYALASLDPQATKSENAFRGHPALEQMAERLGVSRVKAMFPGMTVDKARTPRERVLATFFEVYVDEYRIDETVNAYQQLSAVKTAYKIPAFTVYATPDDPLYRCQWSLPTVYGIDADQAWEIETGSADVVVAVIDQGIQYDNIDLGGTNPPGPADNSTNGNIWVNDMEIPGDGIDNDDNGYIDDVIGYDFVEPLQKYPSRDEDTDGEDNDPMDYNGHGTFCSAEIAAITNNGHGMSGIAGGYSDGTTGGDANGVKILPCRAGYETSKGAVVVLADAAQAMVYLGQLKARGVNIAAVNCSFGSGETPDLVAAADYLTSQDVLVVVAAGNSNSDIPDYLASRSDCLSVGGTALNGDPYAGSNFGEWVDIAAPSVGILSFTAGADGPLTVYQGTSAAAPHVCGVAALLESYDPGLSAQDKWDIMCDPANVKPYNQVKYVGAGIVSAKLALEAIASPSTVPPVADFVAYPTSGMPPLEVSFIDRSRDGATGWEWNFGDDSPVSYERNPAHTYTDAGVYSVTLTVTNSAGANSVTKTDFVNTLNPPEPTMHVENMLAWRRTYNDGINYAGFGMFWVFDNNNRPVADAEVYLSITGPTEGERHLATGADGMFIYMSPRTKDYAESEWCYEVTDMVHETHIYDPEANLITKVCESGPEYAGVFRIAHEAVSPTEAALSQNYPNPFNPSTEFRFSLKESGRVTLTVYNIQGQKVAVLANDFYSPGFHTVTWDASQMSSGVYLYRLETEDKVETKKMVLVK